MSQKRNFYLLLVLILLSFWSLQKGLHRDLWFDEALTLLNFVQLSSWGQIYHSYVIPNNQIVHTILVKSFLPFAEIFGNFVMGLRLLPLITALAVVVLLFKGFAPRFGAKAIFIATGVVAISPVFSIYGTALRGYMLSALIVTGALLVAMKYMQKGAWSYLIAYFALSTLCVGVIPTNLLAMVAVVLYVTPLAGKTFYKSKRLWLVATAPVAGFLLFYGPIWGNLMSCAKLGEGSNASVVLVAIFALYSSLFATLLPTMFIHRRWLFMIRQSIWLLPIPVCLILPVAPFPRTFFVLFPFWIILVAEGLKHLEALKLPKLKVAVWAISLILIFFQQFNCEFFSDKFGDGEYNDDFFAPYYMRTSFAPLELIAQLRESEPSFEQREVYTSFCADPWSFLLSGAKIVFDGPGGQVSTLRKGSFVILRKDEDAFAVGQRFGSPLVFIKEFGRYRVYKI